MMRVRASILEWNVEKEAAIPFSQKGTELIEKPGDKKNQSVCNL
jgi:hypothetical protein